jgi:uncharacterized membrane protein
MAQITVDARDTLKRITINVEVRVVNLRWVKMRLWLAVRLCHLAAWVGGIGLKVNQQVGVIVTTHPGQEIFKRGND